MRIFNHIEQAIGIPNPVLTLGTFDGVHLGHQSIIRELNAVAERVGGESVLLTFEPHPRVVLGKNADGLQLLSPIVEKAELLKKYGLKNLIIHPFTHEFSQITSKSFIEDLLCGQIGIHTIVVGFDHHFGKNREGDFNQLNAMSKELGYHCEMMKEVSLQGNKISSTRIRKALLSGNIEEAGAGLGRNYTLSGEVIQGDQLGRNLGFPTANLKLEKYKLIPGDGVYLTKVFVDSEVFKGLLSIGNRPTVTDSGQKRVEVYILDFDRDIYGKTISVELIRKIREDIKFDSVEELVAQMNKDKEVAEKANILPE